MKRGSVMVLSGLALLVASGDLAAQVRSGSGIRVAKETGATSTPTPAPTPAPSPSLAPTRTDTLTRPDSLAPARTDTTVTAVATTVTLPTMLASNDETLLRGFTDANIVAHIVTGDSLEAEIARLAETRATSTAVRDYARTLVTEHTANRQETIALANDEDTGNQPHPSDPGATHLGNTLTELQNMASGEAWDRTFMMHQLMHHHHELLGLRVLKDVARDDDLEQQIDKIMPVIQRHLDQGRTVATGLGMTVSSGN